MGDRNYFGRPAAWQKRKFRLSPGGRRWYAEYEAAITRGDFPDPIDAVFALLNLLSSGRDLCAMGLAQLVECHVESPRSPFATSVDVVDWMAAEGLLEPSESGPPC